MTKNARPSLRDAVDSYVATYSERLDEPARELLARLADDREALRICERLKLEEDSFLMLCVWFEQAARTFPTIVEELPKRLQRLQRLDAAITELRGFVVSLSERPPPHDLLATWMQPRPDTVAAMTLGLDLIAKAVERQRRAAELTPQRLGMTRKRDDKEAAANSAIFQAVEAVRDATGKPHEQDIADLAQVILKLQTTPSVDRVRHAVASRRRR